MQGVYVRKSPAWNKGLRKETDPRVAAYGAKGSLAKLGCTPWNKGKKNSQKAWNKGLKLSPLSEDHKNRLSEVHRAEKSYRWKGGKIIRRHGYVMIYSPDHPHKVSTGGRAGYVLEHRLVMEKEIGRYLIPGEVVHHINEIKDDNRPENLMLFSSNAEHIKYHAMAAA